MKAADHYRAMIEASSKIDPELFHEILETYVQIRVFEVTRFHGGEEQTQLPYLKLSDSYEWLQKPAFFRRKQQYVCQELAEFNGSGCNLLY